MEGCGGDPRLESTISGIGLLDKWPILGRLIQSGLQRPEMAAAHEDD